MWTTLIPVVIGAFVGAAVTWWFAVAQDRARSRQQTGAFCSGLVAELKRCGALDLKVPGDALLNLLAFPHIVAFASGGVHVGDVPEAAGSHIIQVYYCIERFRRWIEAETPLLRDSYSPDCIQREKAKKTLLAVRNAAVAELEGSLRHYASQALAAMPSPEGRITMKHAKPVFWDKQLWTLVGVAVLIVITKVAGLNLSGADDLAIAGVAAAFIVMDIQRDIAHNRKP
jgi:hypothetical protein